MSINSIIFLKKIFPFIVLWLLTDCIFIENSSDAAVIEAINKFNVDDIVKGTYSFRFRTSENTEREENGYLDNEGNLVVDGFYSYTDPDGKEQYVSYHADKDGFRTFKVPPITAVLAGIDPNAVASLLG